MTVEHPESDPEPTVASAIRWGRYWTDQSLRRLARSSGVSPAQLSRLEAGQVAQPSVETLVALAPALNIHPTVLLVLGGQLRGEQARLQFHRLLDRASEAIAREYDQEEVERLHTEVDAAKTDEDLRRLCPIVIDMPVSEVGWPEGLASLVPSSLADSGLLRELIDAWPELTPERRWRLVELVRDLRVASRPHLPRHGHPPTERNDDE